MKGRTRSYKYAFSLRRWGAVLTVCCGSTALLGQARIASSTEVFERIKGLEGVWNGRSQRGGDSTLVYRVVGRGSAVVEQYSDRDGDRMETVYYLEGSELMLRHYCVAKNQPRMRADSFDRKTGKLNFEFVDADNLTKGAGHMHKIWLQFIDSATITSGAEYYRDDKPLFSEATTYKRAPK